MPSAASLEEAHIPHLDALVHSGWAGLLACRSEGPALPLQLLGLPQAGVPPLHTLPERFKQLRALLLTDSAEVAEAGRLAGCHEVQQLGSGWQPAAQLAAHICKLLKVQPLPSGAAPAAAPVAAVAPALAAVFAAASGRVEAAAGEQQQQEQQEEEGDEVIDMLLLVLQAAQAPPGGSNIDLSTSGSTGSAADDAADPAAGAAGAAEAGGSSSRAALEWADSLLRHLNQVPGFRETVLTSLVLGPGQQPLGQQPLLLQEQPLLLPGRPCGPAAAGTAAAGGAAVPAGAADPAAGVAPGTAQGLAGTSGDGSQTNANAAGAAAPAGPAADCPQVRRPLQSYQFSGLECVAVDAHRPAVVVHRLPGVIRVDRASTLGLQHIVSRGAAGCILAERLLPEVAYKLGRASKYGA